MNENTEYEKFTQEIYQTLINAQGITNIIVNHNVKILGKSGQKHQIDVYWEYEIADVIHKVAIECKNYNKEVSVGKVRDFYGVLADIGNVNGIIVTKKGFQSGSRTFAQQYGINLKELREPIDEDWDGRIKTIVFNTVMISRKVNKLSFLPDEEWVKHNIVLPESGSFSYTIQGRTDQIWVLDKDGNKLKSLYQLEQELPQYSKEEKNLEHRFQFEDGYIVVEEFGQIKIKAIQYIYDVNTASHEFEIDAKNTVKAILKDAMSGEIKFFDKDGNIK